jgi:hypothetical protein
MSTPPKNKDDLWNEFREKVGADKQAMSARTLAIGVVVALLVVAALALR